MPTRLLCIVVRPKKKVINSIIITRAESCLLQTKVIAYSIVMCEKQWDIIVKTSAIDYP